VRTLLLLFLSISAAGQVVHHDVPQKINASEKFLFYLHGGVVTSKGDNAINDSRPEWGRYEYRNILDSLKKRGFNVISENRQKDVGDSVYVRKLVAQVTTLLKSGVPAGNILVVGASAGWHIAILAAARLKNPQLKFVIMGGCWPDTHKEYSQLVLMGKFLSIYEASDPHQSCLKLFEGRTTLTSSKEIMLNTGLSHGFIYKGYKEWIDPVVGF
jgi:hypothetical protein